MELVTRVNYGQVSLFPPHASINQNKLTIYFIDIYDDTLLTQNSLEFIIHFSRHKMIGLKQLLAEV